MITMEKLKDIKDNIRSKLVDRLEKTNNYIINNQEIKLKGDYYEKQIRIALKNCDIIDPNNIDEYIALEGYFALSEILHNMRPLDVIEELKKSGLRGRGGAGFPTGIKWETAYKYDSDKKYIICNADEGDPGAFMDRSILEKDPHSVLEAMAIAGYSIGSDQGFIYVRAEYPKAVDMLKKAISQAKEYGLLGKNILGTEFDFDIELRLGSGAFVCGEGTALMESIEGKRGMPRTKVYRTAHKGLWQKPTIINNVETFANIPVIFRKGVDWFKNIGTEKSPGTKVFALVGKVKNAGLIEVAMGTTLNEIIDELSGGTIDDKKIKAIQTGGPSGGCIPEHLFDTSVDFESLAMIGSIMGSGGMVVMDEDDCMVDIAKFFLDFTVDESCGKCVPCREGTKRMYEILDRITKGKGTREDIERLESLANTMSAASLCGLGQTAGNPVVSTLKFFRDEYLSHIMDKRCPAGRCSELMKYTITDKCIGCTSCARKCPVNCISGERKEIHEIDQDLCIKCGSCYEVCPVNAVVKG
ncbi:NADH-ubiquinone oxidoreductase-F iron-sulfur binding region domain-containing protein [Senegalia massiliensis]|uniref:NADH-ubiquinone oxidoreductase-F iron-sulfur binding region domain-containing protein n=1 Tax=Senegalia massiliensis TaxID=1720316 RepID=UPI00103169D1|nr:NADH-ubiquinone oxidoreductase-F iron-sulfur binding region domain-containing protein [Senegalia massiliensis]